MKIDREPLYDMYDRLLGVSVHATIHDYDLTEYDWHGQRSYSEETQLALRKAGYKEARGLVSYYVPRDKVRDVYFFAPTRTRYVPDKGDAVMSGSAARPHLKWAIDIAYNMAHKMAADDLYSAYRLVMHEQEAMRYVVSREYRNYMRWAFEPILLIGFSPNAAYGLPARLYGLPLEIRNDRPAGVIDFAGPHCLVEIPT